jgi:hypothetical protein
MCDTLCVCVCGGGLKTLSPNDTRWRDGLAKVSHDIKLQKIWTCSPKCHRTINFKRFGPVFKGYWVFWKNWNVTSHGRECRKMTHGWGVGVLNKPKKRHVLFEWPLKRQEGVNLSERKVNPPNWNSRVDQKSERSVKTYLAQTQNKSIFSFKQRRVFLSVNRWQIWLMNSTEQGIGGNANFQLVLD